jgi:AAA+ superfamily predicted ATPase
METSYRFVKDAGRIQNAGLASTIILSGNIHDLFYAEGEKGGEYVPLVNLLAKSWNVPGKTLVVYDLNGPIRFQSEEDRKEVEAAWVKWRSGYSLGEDMAWQALVKPEAGKKAEAERENFANHLRSAQGNPAFALEFLRQLCLCSRSIGTDGRSLLSKNLIIVITRADLLIPEGEVARLSDSDRQRINICQHWFSDYGFLNGRDTVILIAESRSLLNREIGRLPQVMEVEIPSPNQKERENFISWFSEKNQPEHWGDRYKEILSRLTAGLSIHALRQLLTVSFYEKRTVSSAEVIGKVEIFIQDQLGEGMVEFKKPAHQLDKVIGNRRLKAFLASDLIPRLKTVGEGAINGAIVCGPIGGGKTFVFEAMAAELDMVVLVLKNIRSQWYGQTDVLFERLRRVLEALDHVLIFIDEADTQFGGVGQDVHETERRLTGKLQAMMSDTRLRGRVFWLLITARIHLLSPDIRRPGRAGDLIIPVFDPQGEDREEFLRWTLKPLTETPDAGMLGELQLLTKGFSAASFTSLKAELAAKKKEAGSLAWMDVREIVSDHVPPAISETRRYQELQALINCTRRSLLPNPMNRNYDADEWEKELRSLEAKGVR